MSADEVEVIILDGIGWVAFNRPHASNAVRPETLRQLCMALDTLSADDSVRAIVLTGNGRHFAAGADFAWLEELLETKAEEIRDSLYQWFVGAARRLWRCPKPTIAAVNGAAVTVGCELSLVCDVRLASESTVFHESWLKLGLLPPLGGAVLLPRLIGLGRASEMILDARPVRGAEAVQIGLASELVDPDQLRLRATERAQALLQFPARSYRLAKEALRRPLDADMEREWQANVMAQSLLLSTDEFRRRVRELKATKPQANVR
jgi:enoyl-CoA hydratase/carnithine racemase